MSHNEKLLSEFAHDGNNNDDDGRNKRPRCFLCFQQSYVLTMYCFVSAIQALCWMTYISCDPWIAYDYLGLNANGSQGSFSNSTKEYIATWILNEGPIGYMLTVFTVPVVMLHKDGLRYCMLLAGILPLLAAIIRMIPTFISPDVAGRAPYLWIVFVAQALNAVAAPFTQSLPSQLSQTWFGVSWRAFATSVGRVSNAGGRAIGYAIGPPMVNAEGNMDSLMWLEFGLAAIIFVAVLVYFPSAPSTAPTRSAQAFRESVTDEEDSQQTEGKRNRICSELSLVVCSKSRTILLLFAFGIQMGAYGAWSGVLIPALTDAGMGTQEASNIGTYNTVAGVVGGVAIGVVVVAKQVAVRLKLLLIVLSLAGAATFALVTIALPPVLVIDNMSQTMIVFLCTLGGLFRGMLDPLFFEFATEISYPAPAAVVGGILTVWTHVVMVIVLSLPATIVNAIAMYLMPASLVITAILVALVKGRYHRLAYDEQAKAVEE